MNAAVSAAVVAAVVVVVATVVVVVAAVVVVVVVRRFKKALTIIAVLFTFAPTRVLTTFTLVCTSVEVRFPIAEIIPVDRLPRAVMIACGTHSID